MNATMTETDQAMSGGDGFASGKVSARHRYFNRISHIPEQGVLVFVILATLLGNYVMHGYVMREMLIS